MNSQSVWTKRLRSLSIILVVVSFIGVLDATYLSASYLKGTNLVCGGFGDCTGVTTSKYSEILGIPVAYFGFLYYATFFLFSLTVATFKKRALILPLFVLSFVGLLASVWFVFAQLVLLKSICIYCMGSALSSTALFVVAFFLWRSPQSIGAGEESSTGSTELEQA